MTTPAQLYAYFDKHFMGELSRDAEGVLCFLYAPAWIESSLAFPLSLALPLQKELHRGRPVEAYFENLLPEGRARRKIEQLAGIAEGSDLEYLRRFGADCAGAITLRAQKKLPVKSRARHHDCAEVTEAALQNIIENDAPLHLAVGMGDEDLPRFSLAGAQAKFPCLLDGSRILLAADDTPTTHIVKLPMRAGNKLLDSVANEFIVMTLARACGLNVPNVQVLGSRYPVYVVERFDRTHDGAATHRLHSQDFCQALSVPSREKYTQDGGPSAADCYRIIADNSMRPSRDLLMFINWLAFNLAIGNNDTHAKNLSLLVTPVGVQLAPFYDLLATVLYPQFSAQFALPIGGVTSWERIRPQNIAALAQSFAIKPAFLAERWQGVFSQLLASLKKPTEDLSTDTAMAKTFRKVQTEVSKRVKHLLKYALK